MNTTRTPLEPSAPRRYYADCSSWEGCVVRPGDAPFSSNQQSSISIARGRIGGDATCQAFLAYLDGLPANGGLFIYNSRLTDYGEEISNTTWGGPIDYQAEIRLGSPAFRSTLELARTMIHEAAHAVLGANDDPASLGPRSAYYWESQCVG